MKMENRDKMRQAKNQLKEAEAIIESLKDEVSDFIDQYLTTAKEPVSSIKLAQMTGVNPCDIYRLRYRYIKGHTWKRKEDIVTRHYMELDANGNPTGNIIHRKQIVNHYYK